MTTAYTTLLGLALPVQGELTGTWGTTVNNSITQLIDDAVAGTATASVTSGDWTLTDTGSGAPNQARCAILIATGTPGVSRNIIAPARSKGYFVVNQSDAAVVLKGASTTGISIPTTKSALVVWNGTDFVEVSPGTVTSVAATVPSFLSVSGSPITSSGTLAISLSGTALPVANGGTGTTSPALVAGTNVTISGTWPNQTINATSSGGTVTSVTGTAPVVSSGGTTPAISMAAATTSVNGYLTSTDWNTFNGKYSTGGALGTPSSGTLSSCTVDGTDAVGFRNIPVNSQSAAYTAVLADSGKCILHPSTDANARTFTIPANASVAYPIGTAISFVNMTSQVVSIAITSDTMYLAGTGTTGTRSLAIYGTATALKINSTTWIISGAGLT